MKKLLFNPIVAAYLGIEISAATAIACTFATYIPFLSDRGMNLWQINIINAFYMAMVFLAELPTGSFADRFGRHRSLVISFGLMIIGHLVYFSAPSFAIFIVAELILAAGITFYSGAAESWMVDSLKVRNEHHLQAKIFRLTPILKSVGTVVGVVFGAYLGNFNLAWPWLASSLLTIITFVLALRLKENYRSSFEKKSSGGLNQQFHYAWNYGVKNPNLFLVMAFGGMLAFSVQAVNMQWTLMFQADYGFNSLHLGLIFMASSILSSLGSKYSHRLTGGLNGLPAIILPQVFTGAAIIACSFITGANLMLIVFSLHNLGRGIIKPLHQDFINDHLESETRATLLSLDSMFLKAGAFTGLLVSGFVAQATSIRTTWFFAGSFLIVGVVLFFLAIKARERRANVAVT